jgi:hypothetical protein
MLLVEHSGHDSGPFLAREEPSVRPDGSDCMRETTYSPRVRETTYSPRGRLRTRGEEFSVGAGLIVRSRTGCEDDRVDTVGRLLRARVEVEDARAVASDLRRPCVQAVHEFPCSRSPSQQTTVWKTVVAASAARILDRPID